MLSKELIEVFNIADFNRYQKNEEMYKSSLYKFLEGIDNDEET